MTRHLLRDDDLAPDEQAEVLALAAELKRTRHTDAAPVPLRAAGFLTNAVAPDVLRLAPPLVLTDAQVDVFVAALPAALDAAVQGNGS